MAVTCYIAEVQDPTVSLFSFVDTTGATTPGGVKTKLVGIDAGSYQPEMGLFAPDIGDGSFRTRRRAPSTDMVIQLRTSATSQDNHRAALNRLFSLLEIPRVIVYQGEGMAEAVHIHTLGATVESLLRGSQQNWDLIVRQFEDVEMPLTIQRQPIIILASDIVSSVNVLTNSMLYFDQSGTNGAVDGRPDGWTWRDTAGAPDATNISLESTGGTNDGYGASLATAVIRELTQDEAGASPGQVWSGQCVVASAVAALTITPVIYFLNGASAIIATALGSSAVGPISKETRLTVTSAAAPAGTASVRLALRVDSSSAPAKAFVLQRAQLELAASASRFRTGPESVPNDPALVRGRNAAFWNDGEASVPVRVTVTMPAGTPNVQASFIGKRAQFGAAGLRRIGDLQETRYAQAEGSERGWTVAFGTDTTAPVLAVDADASGASLGGGATNFARITHATNPSIPLRRMTFTRTTKLDSLRGRFKVFGRFRPPTTPKQFGVTLKWAPAIADPAPLVEPEVLVDTYSRIGSGATPTLTSGFVEVELGSIELPLASDVSIAGLTLELWTRVILPTPITAANLDCDLIWLVPADAAINEDSIGTLQLSASAQHQVVGRELTSPPFRVNPPDPIWIAGAAEGNAMRLNLALEAVGLGPNAPGTVYGVGRHRVTFTLSDTLTGVRSVKVRVSNVTGGIETVANTYSGTVPKTIIMEWTGAAGIGYQPMVGLISYGSVTAGAAGFLDVLSIQYEFVPVAGASQQLRSDPSERYVAELYSSAGALLQPIDASGELPFMSDRGLNYLSLRQDDIPLTYYLDRQNRITQLPTVSFSYRPGFYQL